MVGIELNVYDVVLCLVLCHCLRVCVASQAKKVGSLELQKATQTNTNSKQRKRYQARVDKERLDKRSIVAFSCLFSSPS